MKKILSMVLILAGMLSCASSVFAEGDPVVLRFAWWGGDARHAATLEAIELYESLNPNVKIEAEYQGIDGYSEKILTQLSGGMQPDIFAVIATAPAEYYAAFPDSFLTLDDQDIFDMSGFEQSFLEKFCCNQDGRLVSFPTGINSCSFILNRTVFEKTGVELPDSWTWDEFIEVGKQIHAADPDCYLLTLSDNPANSLTRSFVRQITGQWTIAEDNTVVSDRDALIAAFTWLQKLYIEGVCEPVESSRAYSDSSSNKKFLNNEVACFFSGSSSVANLDTSNGLQLELVNIPIMEGAVKTGVLTQPAQCMMISKNERSEEALKFMNWFWNDPDAAMILKDCRGVPPVASIREFLEEKGELNPVLSQGVSKALSVTDDPIYPLNENTEVFSFMFSLMEQLCYMTITPEEAADIVINDLPEIVAEII